GRSHEHFSPGIHDRPLVPCLELGDGSMPVGLRPVKSPLHFWTIGRQASARAARLGSPSNNELDSRQGRTVMAGRLEGKVAFITGAARGQGRAHALRQAEEGADIIAVDICRQIESNPYPLATPEDLAETERQIKELGRRVVTAQADVRERGELREALEN